MTTPSSSRPESIDHIDAEQAIANAARHGADDVFFMPLQCSTQWDGWATSPTTARPATGARVRER
ncbi:hypothetical protein Acsp04_19660 [Actinomadura sp. NBRC 104425]|nr:hypothetical protein Acsp04_19660 [Actinomadura sp. NBRC 104425]